VKDTMPPIGSVVAWHKNLKGVPVALPLGWMECNGQKISAGPLTGERVPNLNGERRFLRGGSTSGIAEEDQFQGHYHSYSFANSSGGKDGKHDHPFETALWSQPINKTETGPEHDNYQGFGKTNWPHHERVSKTTLSGEHTHAIQVLGPETDKSHGQPRIGDETRPVNLSIVWIMRTQ